MLPLAEKTELLQAVQTHVPRLLHPMLVSEALFPAVSHETIAQLLKQYEIAHVIFAPMIAGESVRGIFGVFGKTLDANDLAPFGALAQQAATALQNAQLYQAAQTRTRELQALYEASRLLNASLDVRTICENSVNSLHDILGYHHVSIYFKEKRAPFAKTSSHQRRRDTNIGTNIFGNRSSL